MERKNLSFGSLSTDSIDLNVAPDECISPSRAAVGLNPSGEVARMLSHEDLVAAVLEQLDIATREEVEAALAWAWARVEEL